MSTISDLFDVAAAKLTAIGALVDSDLLPRLVPDGGSTGDVLTRGSGSTVGWAEPTGGGGEGPAEPSLSPTSGTQSFTNGVAKSVDVSTVSDGTLASIASVTPSLPSGITATVGSSGTKIHVAGTASATSSATSYVIVANVTGGGTLTYTLSLAVVDVAPSNVVVDVTFDGLSTDTSLEDSTGNTWTPFGGATLDGVVPSGGGFQCTDTALLDALVLGTGDFKIEVQFQTTANDITLFDLGTALGLPIGMGQDASSNPCESFYSTAKGSLTASMAPFSMNFNGGGNVKFEWERVSGVLKFYVNGSNLFWADTADTTDYSATPVKLTLGSRQADATVRPFVGTIKSAKFRVGSA